MQLAENTSLVTSDVNIKGEGELGDFVTIVDTEKAHLIDGATLKGGTTADLNSIKKLIEVDAEKFNFNDVKLSDSIISPEDFLQIYDRVTF